MFELEGCHDKPPRFPFIAAALCVACLGAAAWTWMRYSYCWHMPLMELRSLALEVLAHSGALGPHLQSYDRSAPGQRPALVSGAWPSESYVRVRAVARACPDGPLPDGRHIWILRHVSEEDKYVYAVAALPAPDPPGVDMTVTGRVRHARHIIQYQDRNGGKSIGTWLDSTDTVSQAQASPVSLSARWACSCSRLRCGIGWGNAGSSEKKRGHNTGMKADALRRLP